MQRWHFPVAQPLTLEAQWEQQIRSLLGDWSSHEILLSYEIDFPYRHFLRVVADPTPSGCAKDKLHRAVFASAERIGISLLPRHYVGVLKPDLVLWPFDEIRRRYKHGQWISTWRILDYERDLSPVPLEQSSLHVAL
ncbi:MAG: hypothetical protein ACUVRD_08870 [Bacteroidia bacterium]